MVKIEVGPATRADVAEYTANFSGGAQLPPYRVLALAGKADGKVIGVGGICMLPNGVRLAFADLAPEAHKYPVALHKAGLAGLAQAKNGGIKRVVATATTIESGERWLLRLGFHKEVAPGGVIYVKDL